MGKTLYLECESGISGDMTVAALLDLGADQQVLKKALASLPVQGFDIRISRVKKSGLDACDFDVVLDKEHENHDHDMEYLHGHTHATEHMHGHDVHNHDASGICILLSVTSDRSWYLLDRRCGIQRYPAGYCQQTYGKDGYGRTDPQKCGENECQT